MVMHCEYNGKLRVFKDDGYYILQLYFQQYEKPRVTIATETDDDCEFLRFVKDELQARAMNLTQFWRLDRLDNPIHE